VLTEISDLPEGVTGFEVSGKLTTEDYRDVLDPALHRMAEAGGIRLVFVMPAFEGFSGPAALWEDAKLGAKNWRAWKRAAFVTDVEWMAHGIHWFGWMSPGEVKHFSMAERDAAIAWAAV
jgi:hypothetical protein